MKKLYIFLTVGILFMVILVVIAFIFFEKEKHQSLFYMLEVNGEKIGYVKIDYYKTEDKIIYKSTAFRPKELDNRITYEKIVFNRKKFMLGKFIEEHKNFGTVTGGMYIINNNETFDFLAKSGAKFSTVSNIAHAKDISVFNNESMVTYIPFVDKYNFTRGGAQSFNALFYPLSFLPPARGRVVFASIRDEYIDVDGKKTKTECLVVKTKTPPESYIWVSKKDRSIVQLKIKSKALLVKKVAFPEKITVHDYKIKEASSYDSRNILFPSGDIALAGTIVVPKKEGTLPGVLLVTGAGVCDRENAGLYTDISHELAQSGYVVLRFDKRGIGKSQGDSTSENITTQTDDIKSALQFLLNYEKVDKDKAFIIAHSDACSYLPQLDFSKFPVRGLIMLSAIKPMLFLDFDCENVREKMRVVTEIDKRYLETLELLKEQTLNLIKNTKKEYIFVQGERLFVKKMSQLFEFKPLEGFKKLTIPFIIIQGKKDKFGSLTYIENIEKVLEEAGFEQYSLVYFRGLGHFLGEIMDEKNTVKYYKLNKEVLETISKWLNDRRQGAQSKKDITPQA